MSEQREVRQRLAYLLGFIVLMEEKVERLKQELAGHDEFDTRVAYLLVDPRNKGYICLSDLTPIVKGVGSSLSLDARSPTELASFFKRYGNGDRLTYNEYSVPAHSFLREIRPKMNLPLSQSLMVRNIMRRQLPAHIQERFELLLAYYLLLAAESERLKVQVQSELGLNFVEIHRLMRHDMASEARIQAFFQQNGDEVTKEQTRYLINHTRDLRDFGEWTEQEFKEIFTPVDSLRMFEEVRPDYQLFQHRPLSTQPDFRTTNKHNYLGVRFSNSSYGRLQVSPYVREVPVTSRVQPQALDGADSAINPPFDNIDRFMRNRLPDSRVSEASLRVAPGERQLDRFIVGPKKQVQEFEDDLEESQKSAFRYY